MKLIARVEGEPNQRVRRCRLLPRMRFLRIDTRPPLPIGELITVSLPGLPAPTGQAIELWLEAAYRERPVDQLRPSQFTPTVIGDFLDAVNAHEHIAAVREWNADAIAGFARDKGGVVLAEIRAELDGRMRPAVVVPRARRLADVIGISDAKDVLDELAKLHDVEHLVALEHAVTRWIAIATEPREGDLDQLAHTFPADGISAGISEAWFQWWWRLARACTRADLIAIVDRTIELADKTCTEGRRQPLANEARADAHRLAEVIRVAPRAVLWSEPVDPKRRLAQIERDEDDAHYAAFIALTHAAHAIAHAHGGHLDAEDANRWAMRAIAELAIKTLRDQV